MWAFITKHFLEIIFGLISTGSLAFCKYLHKEKKKYQKLVDEKRQEELDETIDKKIEPIIHEIEELRSYIRNVSEIEKNHISLIISSYRFRLIQLCKQYLKQGYMTQSQYDQVSEFFKLYHELGGNGQAEQYYDKTMKLEIRD